MSPSNIVKPVSGYEHLLAPGEYVEPIDRTIAWGIPEDTDVIVDQAGYAPPLFDIPVRITVERVSSIGTLAIVLKTKGAKDSAGNEWSPKQYGGWFDLKWDVKGLVKKLDGECLKPAQDKINLIRNLLAELLNDEDRLEAMDDVCKYCGRIDPDGQCCCTRDD
jgi:hypothetical protein